MLGILAAAGAGLTIADYREWKHAELDRYGQGPGDLQKPAMQLTEMYHSKILGIRLRLPQGWRVKEERELIDVAGMMTVKVSSSSENLTDLVNKEIVKMIAAGVKLTWEREYAVTEKMDMTVITWSEEQPGGTAVRHQKVMGKMRDRLMEAVVSVQEEKWGEYEKTFWEIYRNIEMI